MMYKLLGASLIFLGCSAVGFASAADLTRELQLIRAFSASLALLRFEIGYRARTLPEIFYSASESVPEPLSGFFYTLAGLVSESPGEPLCGHISASLRSTVRAIPKVIRDSMQRLGASLGGTDAEAQLHMITLCEEQIQIAEREMLKEFTQRCSMRRTIGVCSGALLAIFLL